MKKLGMILLVVLTGQLALAQAGLPTVDGRPYSQSTDRTIAQLVVDDQMVVRQSMSIGEKTWLRVLLNGGHSICIIVTLREMRLREGEVFTIFRTKYEFGMYSIYMNNEMMEPTLLITCTDYSKHKGTVATAHKVPTAVLDNVFGLNFK